MNTLLKSDVVDAWLVALQDRRGKARIITGIRRAELGNFGDTKPVGEGVHEMRVHCGPGYRVCLLHAPRGAVVLASPGWG